VRARRARGGEVSGEAARVRRCRGLRADDGRNKNPCVDAGMKRGSTAAGLSEDDQDLKKCIRELDADGALGMLDELCDMWHLGDGQRGDNFEDQTMLMFQVFGLNFRSNMTEMLEADEGSFGLREIDRRIRKEELKAIGLYHRLHELGLLPEQSRRADDDEDQAAAPQEDGPDEPDDAKVSALRRIVKVLEMVFYAKRVVLSAFQAKLAVHQLHLRQCNLDLDTDLDTRLGSWALRFRYIQNKMTPMQNLLLFLLDGAMEKRFRKSNGWMYEPVFVDGRNTHAWKPVMEIKDFVYSMLHKETCWEQWCNATAAGLKNISSAIDYLTNCSDYQLPELLKQRGVYSFRNGVYMARTDTFHAFGEGRPLSDDVVACKFMDARFPREHAPSRWYEIPTPYLQSIMDYQGFDPDVCHWLYVMLGRLLYPLNELDSWQVIPFFKGQASSGKSTIVLKVCKSFYDAQDVGLLSNNIERKFGLSAFYDKYLFVAPEIKSDLGIEQAEFQSVVSGEDLQVNVKHKKAFATTWSVPGALAGNEVPAWADNSGSVQRRVILFEFVRAVTNGDMKLGDKLLAELPEILLKCNKAYLDMVAKYSHVNLWTVLPRYFKETRDQLAQSVNSVEAFLASTEVMHGPDLHCPMEDFRAALKSFEISNNYKHKKYDTDFFRGPFAKFDLRIERAKKAYRGANKTRDYVVGIDIRSQQDDVGGELS
jgi:phage/plasmid-associated DNA primase